MASAFQPQQRQVGVGIRAHQFSRGHGAVVEHALDAARAAHDMVVCQRIAIR
jgi:hypothetical protein